MVNIYNFASDDIILIIFHRRETHHFTMLKLYTGIILKFSFEYWVLRIKIQ